MDEKFLHITMIIGLLTLSVIVVTVEILTKRKAKVTESKLVQQTEELSNAKSALNESESRYQLLVEGSPLPVLLYKNGRIIYVNGECVRSFRASRPQDMVMHPVLEFVTPEAHERAKHWEASGEMYVGEELKFVRRDGTVIEALSTGVTIPYLGETARLVTFIDVTERNLDRKALEESEALYRVLVEDSPIANVVHTDGVIQFANEAALQLIGASDVNDVIGKSVYEFVHVDDRKRSERALKSQGRRMELRIIRFDQEERYISLQAVSVQFNGHESRMLIMVDTTDRRLAEQALLESEENYRSLIEMSPAPIYVHQDGIFTYANRAGLKLLGYENISAFVGQPVHLTSQDQNFVQTLEERISENIGEHFIQEKFVRQDGKTIDVEVAAKPVTFDGQPGVQIVCRDITERLESQRKLRENEEKYRVLVESSPVAIMVHQNGIIRYVNPTGIKVLGGSCEADILSHQPSDFIHPDDWPMVRERMINSPNHQLQPAEERFVRLDGQTIIVETTAFPIMFNDAPAAQVVFEDVTERKQAEDTIRFMAYHDPLTALPNRTLFMDRLISALSETHTNGGSVAVMLLDVDHFKQINDTLGHTVGDRILKALTTRIKACLRSEDTIARIGGDEFTILIPKMLNPATAYTIATRVIDSFTNPISVDSELHYLTASIGIVVSSDASEATAEELVQYADMAMYSAKSTGRNTYQVYTESMGKKYRHRVEIEKALRHALNNGELDVHFMPIVDAKTQQVKSAEALVRWMRPGYGLVSPAEFIPIAEETGLIMAIGEWVTGQVCQQIRTWQTLGYEVPPIAVNVTAREFMQKDFITKIEEILSESNVDPKLLSVEITESTIVSDTETVIRTLHELSAMGISCAIDDFGTGYSSLSYLKDLPVSKLKIDQSFVRGIDNQKNSAIIRAVIALAKNLGMSVVAEGVETEHQLRNLSAENCDFLQGYLFSKPLPPNEFEQKFLHTTSGSAVI